MSCTKTPVLLCLTFTTLAAFMIFTKLVNFLSSLSVRTSLDPMFTRELLGIRSKEGHCRKRYQISTAESTSKWIWMDGFHVKTTCTLYSLGKDLFRSNAKQTEPKVPSIHIRIFLKRHLFYPFWASVHVETAFSVTKDKAFRKRSPEWTFLKTRFHVVLWTSENRAFR